MAAKRPLSPHLQIYRLPITALLSISHRLSGVILVAGMLALVICLMAGAAGPEPYAQVHAFLNAWPGQLFIWGWIYALFFHWCHGVRHLVWDIGNGFSREYQDIAAYLEITVSLFFTLTAFLANHYLWS
ncbi:MAG: succinate dehydrogenase, cytochrome b556 subunit [Methylococcaceae bacterium]|nr:MAG: succinate dehydrogenase, cytochrome b556 subunit [Methylococcaceae bacterium]